MQDTTNTLDPRGWPAPETFLTYQLTRVVQELNAQGTAYVRRYSDLSLVQWRILLMVQRFGKSNPRDITAATGMDKGLFSRNLKGLISRKLITARKDPKDRRRIDLVVTPTGRALYDKIIPLMEQRQAHVLHGLTQGEVAQFQRMLDIVSRNAAFRAPTG
ncbi:MAG: MarR family winged helix-turn-helix transcriptional regulator [Pseudomonadota bacterium]